MTDPIDYHLACGNGPPLLVEEARERMGDYEDDDLDELLDDLDDDEDDSDLGVEIKPSSSAHVVVYSNAQGAGGKCLHCGATLVHSLPCKVIDWAQFGMAFAEKHARCEPQKGKP